MKAAAQHQARRRADSLLGLDAPAERVELHTRFAPACDMEPQPAVRSGRARLEPVNPPDPGAAATSGGWHARSACVSSRARIRRFSKRSASRPWTSSRGFTADGAVRIAERCSDRTSSVPGRVAGAARLASYAPHASGRVIFRDPRRRLREIRASSTTLTGADRGFSPPTATAHESPLRDRPVQAQHARLSMLSRALHSGPERRWRPSSMDRRVARRLVWRSDPDYCLPGAHY